MSHLSSVVRFSLSLPPGPETRMAMELCEYGEKTSPRYRGEGQPPFDQPYTDEKIFLRTLLGEQVEEGISHFRAKLEAADLYEIGTMPAEALVNLLLRVDRPAEAVKVFAQHLT